MDTHSKGLTDAKLQVLDLKRRSFADIGTRVEFHDIFRERFFHHLRFETCNAIALNEMAGDSVAINPGNAGEHPGASRVAGLPACIFSEVFACGWCRPCKPLGKKTRPLFALSLRGESGESGKAVFGTAVR